MISPHYKETHMLQYTKQTARRTRSAILRMIHRRRNILALTLISAWSALLIIACPAKNSRARISRTSLEALSASTYLNSGETI